MSECTEIPTHQQHKEITAPYKRYVLVASFKDPLSTKINQRRSLCLQVLHAVEILEIPAENTESGQIQQTGFRNLKRKVFTIYIPS